MRIFLILIIAMVLFACNNESDKTLKESDSISNVVDSGIIISNPQVEQKNDTIRGVYIIHLTREYSDQALKKMGGDKYANASAFKKQYLSDLLSPLNIADTSVITDALKYVFYAKLDSATVQSLSKDKRVELLAPYVLRPLAVTFAAACTPTTEKQWGVTYIWKTDHADGDYGVAWILDTGIDPTHPDLNVTLATTFITGVSPNDKFGHGTHMAGIIGAKKNSKGVVGVAPNASLKSIRIYNDAGKLDPSGYYKALDHVLKNGAKENVLNMSLEGTLADPTETKYIQDIAKKGLYVCIAAGNSGVSVENAVYPATINGANIFTVSSMDKTKKFSATSNYGKTSVDFCAPGVDICSTWFGGIYKTDGGTSQATAHLSGLLLLTKGKINSIEKVTGDPDGNVDNIIHE